MQTYTFLHESKFNSEDLRNHETSAGVIRDGQGRFLIQDHVKHDMLTFPIGKVKPPETPLEGLKTEMREELGIDVTEAVELFWYVKTYDFDGKKVRIKTHVFDVKDYKGTPRNKEPKKHRWIKYMKLEDVIKSGRRVADCVWAYYEAKKKGHVQ